MFPFKPKVGLAAVPLSALARWFSGTIVFSVALFFALMSMDIGPLCPIERMLHPMRAPVLACVLIALSVAAVAAYDAFAAQLPDEDGSGPKT